MKSEPEVTNIVLTVEEHIIAPLSKVLEEKGEQKVVDMASTICANLRRPNEEGWIEIGILRASVAKGEEWATKIEAWVRDTITDAN